MEVIYEPKGSGKTTEIIKRVSETKGGYIVCPTRDCAHRIFWLSKTMELDIPLPLSWDEFINRQYSSRNIRYFIFDDLDRCLSYISTVPIISATITKEK
jgi:hypothetical protein